MTKSRTFPPQPNQPLVDERQVTSPAAKEVLAIMDRGQYQAASGATISVQEQQAASVGGTKLYTPSSLDALRRTPEVPSGDACEVAVIDATTQVAAQRFANESPTVLLNFASARNPGGGFFGGAKAQEEELCRCGGLYRTLLTQPRYYATHRKDRSLLYTDHLIYSPRVPFFRTSAKAPLLDAPFFPSVITAPAPNAGAIRRNQPDAESDIHSVFLRRWKNIFAVAKDNSEQILVLGAWGCGAFRNDPTLVAGAANEALAAPQFVGAFRKVVFAIPSFNKHSIVNLEAFRKTFGH